jgi:very-short-patch-repair endonuclease
MGQLRLQWPAAWELARRQHGVVARWQLLALGLNADAIQHRIERGRLHPTFRGVYAVGRPEVSRAGRWMAAVLACGPGSVLSHESAGAAARICSEPPNEIHVSVLRGGRRRHVGIVSHRRLRLDPIELTDHRGIPMTDVVLTLTDLATYLRDRDLEAAIREADKRNLIDPESLRRTLATRPRRPGMARLERLLDRHTFRLTDSELERMFLRLVDVTRLPRPLTQQVVNGHRVDFFWPDLGLVVETDGLRYHRTPSQQAADHDRDQSHAAAGLTPLRFTHAQIRYEAELVKRRLAAVASRLRSSP